MTSAMTANLSDSEIEALVEFLLAKKRSAPINRRVFPLLVEINEVTAADS